MAGYLEYKCPGCGRDRRTSADSPPPLCLVCDHPKVTPARAPRRRAGSPILCGPKAPSADDLAAVNRFAEYLRDKAAQPR